MPQDQSPRKPDLIVELAELSRELRKAVTDFAAQTKRLDKVLRESDKGVGGPPEIVEASKDQMKALNRLHEIWDRARKPIIRLGMESYCGEKVLAEFRCLSLRPNALEVLKFVEFLEVVLDTASDAPAPSAGLNDKVQTQAQKRPRGRPAKIPEERKMRALEVIRSGGSYREAANVLYDTKDPTKTQRGSVSAILKAECKKRGIDWPKPASRTESAGIQKGESALGKLPPG